MKKAAALLLLAAASLQPSALAAGDDGYPHPPAPKWEITDDEGLNHLFRKTIGDRLGRVRWDDVLFERTTGAPRETIRSSVLAVSEGEKIGLRVTRNFVGYFWAMPDDEKHWLPEKPHHWEKPSHLPVWECFVVEAPSKAAVVEKFPDLIRRVYGCPIFSVTRGVDEQDDQSVAFGSSRDSTITRRATAREVREIVDRLWLEVVKQCSAPESYKDSATPLALNRDGSPMWQAVDAIHVMTWQHDRLIATVHFLIAARDDTEGFSFWLEKTPRGWEPIDGFANFLPWYRKRIHLLSRACIVLRRASDNPSPPSHLCPSSPKDSKESSPTPPRSATCAEKKGS